LTADPPEFGDLISQVANIDGEFRLEIAADALYSEEHFPVVELARQLTEWSGGTDAPDHDFEFDSMFFEERGVIWIRRAESGWRVGSLLQLRSAPQELTWEEVQAMIRRYTVDVIDAGRRDLRVDLARTIGPSEQPDGGMANEQR